MNRFKLHGVRNGFLVLVSLALLTLVGQASAQNSAPAAQPPATQQTQTQRSTTTTTQTEQTVQGVDPLWFIIGGIALLAIILIVVLASRGRSRGDSHTHVSERTTVIKKE